ncbi:MAG: hypothetical protein ACOYJ1_12190 [Peptococcales bacterium]|jgi:hypothetical protein
MANNKATEKTTEITITKIPFQTDIFKIKGVTPLLSHEWGRKAQWEMLMKQLYNDMLPTYFKKLPICPLLNFAESLHWISKKPEYTNYELPYYEEPEPSAIKKIDAFIELSRQISTGEIDVMNDIKNGIFGFPSSGVKAAILNAQRYYSKTITKTSLKQDVFVFGPENEKFIIIKDVKGNPAVPKLDETMAKTANKIAYFCYRARFDEWYSEVAIRYNAQKYSRKTIANLLDASGNCGIGEWRPTSPNNGNGSHGMYEICN